MLKLYAFTGHSTWRGQVAGAIRSSSSTTIMWGFSHGASHPSGTSSGIQSDPGTSDAISGLGGVLGNALSEWIYQLYLGGGKGDNIGLETMPQLPNHVHLVSGVPQFRCVAAEVPWPLDGRPSTHCSLPPLPFSPFDQWCRAPRGCQTLWCGV